MQMSVSRRCKPRATSSPSSSSSRTDFLPPRAVLLTAITRSLEYSGPFAMIFTLLFLLLLRSTRNNNDMGRRIIGLSGILDIVGPGVFWGNVVQFSRAANMGIENASTLQRWLCL